MLTVCPECNLQISSKAVVCPHCGYPLKQTKKPPAKRRRLPNGFGQISEIKGRNLAKPFRAMITTGIGPNGRPICKVLKPEGYFKTYNEAYTALIEYNKNPYDMEKSMTVGELYKIWSEKHFATLANKSRQRTVESAWKYCSTVYDVPVKDIRAHHIRECADEGYVIRHGEKRFPTAIVRETIKTTFNQMLDYAVECELTDRNYARTLDINRFSAKKYEVQQEHIPFTDEEIQILWDNREKYKYIDLVLVQCYGGWRPQELGLIELANVNISEGWIKGGMKTIAGTGRIVPIHSKIKNIIEKWYEEAQSLGSKYLFNISDSQSDDQFMSYYRFRNRFTIIKTQFNLNLEHRCHDGRKHFVTMAKKYNVDEYAIKYIVGHAIKDITERVYTEREVKWLQNEIEKIK